MNTAAWAAFPVSDDRARLVKVEADTSDVRRLGGWRLAAMLPTTRDRVRAAMINDGYSWPAEISVCPAGHGSQCDLAIAMAILAVSGQVPAACLEQVLFLAELGLDGALRPVRTCVRAAAEAARAAGMRAIMVAAEDACAVGIPGLQVFPAARLTVAVAAVVAVSRERVP